MQEVMQELDRLLQLLRDKIATNEAIGAKNNEKTKQLDERETKVAEREKDIIPTDQILTQRENADKLLKKAEATDREANQNKAVFETYKQNVLAQIKEDRKTVDAELEANKADKTSLDAEWTTLNKAKEEVQKKIDVLKA